jgi:hypothetical protein
VYVYIKEILESLVEKGDSGDIMANRKPGLMASIRKLTRHQFPLLD